MSLRIASNQAFSLKRSSGRVFAIRASISLARCKAFVYVISVKARSFPIARSHTRPRDLGNTPRHQSSRVPGSRTTCSQFGRTCSSQMRSRADFVSSWAHWTSAALTALLHSNDTLQLWRLMAKSIEPYQPPDSFPSCAGTPSSVSFPLWGFLVAASSVVSCSKPFLFPC